MNKELSDIGLIGLAVMGQNLALNIADHGFRISVYNRTTSKMEAFVSKNTNTPGGLVGYKTLEEFVHSLERPRKVVIMVEAGKGTDAVIDQLVGLLAAGDIIVDGGNAKWTDTSRREKRAQEHGLRFIGSGVSGGEEGARFGPSLMPGGDPEAYKHLKPIWDAISAKVDAKTGEPIEGAQPGKPVQGGVPCNAYIGPSGSGHYVKMVHNGIEYGDMQLICEAYAILRDLLGLQADAIGEIFEEWNKGVLHSFLVGVAAEVLKQKDPRGKGFLVDRILDKAGQKGTGKWTAIHSLEMGVAAPTIAGSVYARCMSALKNERVEASRVLYGPESRVFDQDKEDLIQDIHEALYCSKICSYAQGFELLKASKLEYGWELNFSEIAQIWRGGCIIRAAFLQKITEAYQKDANLSNLILDPYFRDAIHKGQPSWRRIVALCAEHGIASPNFYSALAYYDGFRNSHLPLNLLQGLRDYFGAHSYERTDEPQGRRFHLDWPHPERPEVSV